MAIYITCLRKMTKIANKLRKVNSRWTPVITKAASKAGPNIRLYLR